MKLFMQKTLVVVLAVLITSLFVKGIIQVGDTTIYQNDIQVLYDLDYPQAQLNNHTLREVFEGTNKYSSFATTNGISNGVTFTRSTSPIFTFNGTSTVSDSFSLLINMIVGDNYYIRYTYISGTSSSTYIQTSNGQLLFNNLSVNGSNKIVNSGTIVRYAVPLNSVSNNISFKIDMWKMNDLGISSLSQAHMDYWFNIYVTLKALEVQP